MRANLKKHVVISKFFFTLSSNLTFFSSQNVIISSKVPPKSIIPTKLRRDTCHFKWQRPARVFISLFPVWENGQFTLYSRTTLFLLESIDAGSVSRQEHVDERGHVGNVHIAVTIHIGTVYTDFGIGTQQVVDQSRHVGNVNRAAVVHVTHLIAVANLE